MPSTVSTAIAKGVRTFVECVAIALCWPCIGCLLCMGGLKGPCGTRKQYYNNERYRHWKPPKVPPNPPPLPATRIEIRQPLAEQPQCSHLLNLPLELRECIYEHVLSGRLISLQLVGSQHDEHCVVRSRYYRPVDDLSHGPTRGILPAERISPALLLSCRQVYAEALPILHQRNTFHFWASQLEVVVGSALGEYCLPDIRSVYIYHDNVWAVHETRPWKDVFPILQQMSLGRVAFEFATEPELAELDPYVAVLDDSWARGVLGLRNLQRFELWIHNPREHLVDKTLLTKLRQLMIGPGADERYRIFLKEYKIPG